MKELLKDMFQVTTTKIMISLFSGLLVATGSYLASDNKESAEEEFMESESADKVYSQNNKVDKNSKRSPASKREDHKRNNAGIISSSAPEITNKNEENYNSVNNQTDYFNSGKSGSSTPTFYSPSLSSVTNPSPVFDSELPTLQNTSKDSKPSSSEVFLGAPTTSSTPKTQPDKKTKTDDVFNNSGGFSTPQTNTCSTDILSGTFGNPFGVTITCTYLSAVKYCLAKDVCCDPKTSGTDYSTTITVGAENGNFCLSYYGDSETGGFADVVQNNYTVNSTFPNLNVGNPKTFFQTTELSGESFVTSTDFGKANHFAGQINFKSQDPTATGLNYSCQEIAENDHLTLLPIPSTTLSLFNVSALLPSNEIKIPFREDKIDYGINFLSSFIKNNSYVVPLYSCSTSQIVLEDFAYFESTMAQASTGDNNVREFEGQFSTFGFFEEDAQVFRGPAGESTNEKSGTYLESGLLSVFY